MTTNGTNANYCAWLRQRKPRYGFPLPLGTRVRHRRSGYTGVVFAYSVLRRDGREVYMIRPDDSIWFMEHVEERNLVADRSRLEQ